MKVLVLGRVWNVPGKEMRPGCWGVGSNKSSGARGGWSERPRSRQPCLTFLLSAVAIGLRDWGGGKRDAGKAGILSDRSRFWTGPGIIYVPSLLEAMRQ